MSRRQRRHAAAQRAPRHAPRHGLGGRGRGAVQERAPAAQRVGGEAAGPDGWWSAWPRAIAHGRVGTENDARGATAGASGPT
eukprot:366142-Chlamydomonas_euryale.AAC.11